jgi:PEP-utilizing family enzyme
VCDFVVTWDDPKDAERQWMQDRMHAPEPGTPLGGSVLCNAVTHGFGFAFDEYSVPATFILSHCAVVAREYGIPAVVGCGNATAAIRDGQTIEVDGTNGVVRLVD